MKKQWLVLLIVAVATFCTVSSAAADDPDSSRFSPTTRGQRAYATERVQQWREDLEEYDWHVETALRVIACESEGNPKARNPWSGAKGLFQLFGWDSLAERLTGIRDVFNWTVNIRTAYFLWKDSGEQFSFHWAQSKSCWYW